MRRIVFLVIVLIFAAIACNAPTSPPTTQPTPIPPEIVPSTDVAAPTVTPPESAPNADTDPLPEPLYLLGTDQQIWRVETDGTTTLQITFEPLPVTHYAVAPDGSTIAYASNNAIYTVDSAGASRALIVQGPPPPAQDDYSGRIVGSIGSMYWSPDGQQIAYGLGGLNVYSIIYGTSDTLKASDPYPDPNDPNLPPGPIRFFSAGPFSPDGTRILVPFGYFPEAGGTGIFNLAGGSFTDITNPDGLICCSLSWSQDSTSIYFANPAPGMIPAGLWRADAASGQTLTLASGEIEGGFQMFSDPQQNADGDLLYFFAMSTEFPESTPLLTMTKSSADGVSNRVALRADSQRVSTVLWASDASGAVILDFDSVDQSVFPYQGPLTWLPADGSPPVVLPISGSAPHWGK